MVVEHDDTEQAHLSLGWRSLANRDDDRWALSVANQVLGGGMASRLFQEVREERGLAYSVYSHPTAFADSGYLTIYCGTAPKRAREALAVIDDVLAAVLADGITEHELAVAAGYLEGSMLLGLEDSGSRMARLGRSLDAARRDHPDRRARRSPPGRHHRRRLPRPPPRPRLPAHPRRGRALQRRRVRGASGGLQSERSAG